jgi:hypothetical protein
MALEAKVEYRRQLRRHALRCIVTLPIADDEPDASAKLYTSEIKRQAKHLLNVKRPGYYHSVFRTAHSKQALCFFVYIMFGGELGPPEELVQDGAHAFEMALSQFNAWLRRSTRCSGILVAAAVACLVFLLVWSLLIPWQQPTARRQGSVSSLGDVLVRSAVPLPKLPKPSLSEKRRAFPDFVLAQYAREGGGLPAAATQVQ